jgi:formylglycine-generating enzyme required for sulfatase activity
MDAEDTFTYVNVDATGVCKEDTYSKLPPVGVERAKPNAWDLYEAHVNVWEWVFDTYAAYGTEDAICPVRRQVESDKNVLYAKAFLTPQRRPRL